MRVMRVASYCELRVTASCCELLQVTFLWAFLPLLLLLLYCYLLYTTTFGSPEPGLAPRLRTFLILDAHLQWLSIFYGSWINGSRPRASRIVIFWREWKKWCEWECDSLRMHIVYTVFIVRLLISAVKLTQNMEF